MKKCLAYGVALLALSLSVLADTSSRADKDLSTAKPLRIAQNKVAPQRKTAAPPSAVPAPASAPIATPNASAAAKSVPPKPASAGTGSQSGPVVSVPPKNIYAHVVFRPNFLTADIAHYAGIAFRLRSGRTGRHFLVCPMTMFGPAAELREQMSSVDIARVIVAAVGVAIDDPEYLVIAKPYIKMDDARPTDEKGCEKDIVLFALSDAPGDPSMTVDPAPAIKGDKVWMYTKLTGINKVSLVGATVAWVSPNEIRYHLDDQNADLSNTSGSPLLSSDGLVVGMHIGTFKTQSGMVFGFACPGAALRQAMEGQEQVKAKKSLL